MLLYSVRSFILLFLITLIIGIAPIQAQFKIGDLQFESLAEMFQPNPMYWEKEINNRYRFSYEESSYWASDKKRTVLSMNGNFKTHEMLAFSGVQNDSTEIRYHFVKSQLNEQFGKKDTYEPLKGMDGASSRLFQTNWKIVENEFIYKINLNYWMDINLFGLSIDRFRDDWND